MRLSQVFPLYLATGAMAAPLAILFPSQSAGAQATPASVPAVDQRGPRIKDVYKGHFLIGTAADVPEGFSDQDLTVVRDHFNALTPENSFKPASVHPEEKSWNFARTDALMKWCSDNHIAVHGHTLLWHAQTNPWFFQGGDKQVIIKRMQDHIATLVGRYKGRIYSWDVVNEAINDAPNPQTENLRNSQWMQTVGSEFLTIAFKAAHAADPEAKLYYNDYGIENGAKHESSMHLLRRLIREGAPIYGVGIQGHWSTTDLPYEALDKAISDYAALGLKVSISELDITVGGTSGGQLNPTAPNNQGQGPGFGGGFGPGGRGPRGGAGSLNPADSIRSSVADLTNDQKAKLGAASQNLMNKAIQWQSSAQAALQAAQPQFTPGQPAAYQSAIAKYNEVQFQQNLLRDNLANEAEIAMVAILTPEQAQTWEKARLKGLVSARFATLLPTEAQNAKVEAVVADHAAELAAAKDKASLVAAKAAFWKDALGVLDDTQVTMLLAPAQDFTMGRGRLPGLLSPQALKAQADAYAKVFAIFEKHKDVVERVTFWGLNDRRSWRMGENPLIFDINNQRKLAYSAIVDVLTHPATQP